MEDSSLLEGELSFFMKGRKKYLPAFLDSDHSLTIAFRFTWSNFENCIAALAASTVVLYIYVCGIVGSVTLMGFMVLHFTFHIAM